ncbi:putative house-cleaning noncanonical NTP pyrophosphatase (MazG superfamily) [Chryseobacterium sp. H1D6B]|uniref:hypothetical protein n=1 Tax=Chryseobacterium sp. H1D6B TaxID=2940588 RepID=UPI0015CCBA2E|nr:hypothetical protein [Chryseobacterium sp. H1D6B]MDH6251034.1 putative house-cleaning noncanonical NTP pyrophosphatase (MazG superfamily) [Chryseobacterium sp. H1D6B]
MKRILQFILLISSISLFSQNLEKKISDEICTCLGNLENLKDSEKKQQECAQKSFENNYAEIIKKFNDPQNTHTKDIEDYYISIEALLLNNCKSFLEYRKKEFVREKQESISNCDDIKTGVYYYETLQKKEKSYLTFTKNEVIETRKNNVYSINKIEWTDKCTYKLNLLETNSNYDETYLKNKSLVFRVIENSPTYFVVQTEYFENGGLNNVKIFKLPFINE